MSRKQRAGHVAIVTKTHKGKTYQTHVWWRTYGEEGKVKPKTLGNLSGRPPDAMESIRERLREEPALNSDRPFEITQSLPNSHVAVVLETMRSLGSETVILSNLSQERVFGNGADRLSHVPSRLQTGHLQQTLRVNSTEHARRRTGSQIDRRQVGVPIAGSAATTTDAHRKQVSQQALNQRNAHSVPRQL